MSSFATVLLGLLLVGSLVAVIIVTTRTVQSNVNATSSYNVYTTATTPPTQTIAAPGLTAIVMPLTAGVTFEKVENSNPTVMDAAATEQVIIFNAPANSDILVVGTVSFTVSFTVTSGATSASVRLGVAQADAVNRQLGLTPLAEQIEIFTNTGSVGSYGLSFTARLRPGTRAASYAFFPTINTSAQDTAVQGDLATYVSAMTLRVLN